MSDTPRLYRPSLGWLAVILLFAVPVFTLSGAVDMFLRLEGIKGESVDKARAGDIDVLSWSWGASNSGTTHVGPGAGAGKATVKDIMVTKYIDRASPTLLLNTMNGKHIGTGQLVVRSAGEKPLEYLKIDMKEILITSLNTGGSGGEDRLTETISLNFGSYKLTYTPRRPDGSADTPVVMQWNIAENVPGF